MSRGVEGRIGRTSGRTDEDVSTQALRLISAFVIVTVVPACDNVEWEGSSFALVPPPSRSPESETRVIEPGEPDLGLPTGPVLYMGARTEDRVTLSPVAEIRGDSLRPYAPRGPKGDSAFAADHLLAGSEFILFAEGLRVGRTRIDHIDTDSSFCTLRPAVSGIVELLPAAAGTTRFLALAGDAATTYPYEAFRAVEHSRAQREASIRLSAAVIPEVVRALSLSVLPGGATWPQGDWLDYRVDMRALQPAPDAPSAFASTYLVRDAPRVGPADSTSYAIFVMGHPVDGAYVEDHTWYRLAARDGKGIPIFYEHLDWDGDGQSEVLLEILGETSRWVAALNQEDGEWVRIFEDPCTSASGSPGD